MRFLSARIVLFALASAIFAGGSASAQSGAFADPIRLALTSGDFLALEGARMETPRAYRVLLAYRYLGGAIGAAAPGGGAGPRSYSALDVGGSIAPARFLSVGASLPMRLAQSGGQSGFAVGDLRVAARVQAFEHRGFGAALVLAASVPTGTAERDYGEGGVVAEPAVAAGWSRGRVRVGLNLGARLRINPPLDTPLPAREVFGALGIGVRAHEHLDLFSEAHAEIDIGTPPTGATVPLEILAGAGVRFAGFEGRAAGGLVFDDGYAAPRWRVVVSLSWSGVVRKNNVPAASLPRPAAAPPPGMLPPVDPPAAEPDCAGCDDEGESDEDPDDETSDEDDAKAPVSSVQPGAVATRAVPRWRRLTAPILFKIDSARIRSRYRKRLQVLSRVIVAEPQIEAVWIEGHTDASGPPRWNRTLSAKRASRVAQLLEKYGVPSERLQISGAGAGRPRVSNRGEVARRDNRRADVRASVSSTAPARAGSQTAPDRELTPASQAALARRAAARKSRPRHDRRASTLR